MHALRSSSEKFYIALSGSLSAHVTDPLGGYPAFANGQNVDGAGCFVINLDGPSLPARLQLVQRSPHRTTTSPPLPLRRAKLRRIRGHSTKFTTPLWSIRPLPALVHLCRRFPVLDATADIGPPVAGGQKIAVET
jgi:hypothetical protein